MRLVEDTEAATDMQLALSAAMHPLRWLSSQLLNLKACCRVQWHAEAICGASAQCPVIVLHQAAEHAVSLRPTDTLLLDMQIRYLRPA